MRKRPKCPHVQLKWFQKTHRQQFFNVVIKTSEYKIKNLTVMQKADEPLESFKSDQGDEVR